MTCNIGKAAECLENEAQPHPPTLTSLHLRHSSFFNPSVAPPTSQHILQPFRCFTYITCTSPTSSGHSPTFPLLHLRHSSFSNPSVASPFSNPSFASLLCSFSNLSVTSPTSQLILQPFHRFTYVTAHSPTLSLLHLRHSSFSNPSFASPRSQALHLIHLASRPWGTMPAPFDGPCHLKCK